MTFISRVKRHFTLYLFNEKYIAICYKDSMLCHIQPWLHNVVFIQSRFAPQLYTSKLTEIGNRSDAMIIFSNGSGVQGRQKPFAIQGPTCESGTTAANIANKKLPYFIIKCILKLFSILTFHASTIMNVKVITISNLITLKE